MRLPTEEEEMAQKRVEQVGSSSWNPFGDSGGNAQIENLQGDSFVDGDMSRDSGSMNFRRSSGTMSDSFGGSGSQAMPDWDQGGGSMGNASFSGANLFFPDPPPGDDEVGDDDGDLN